MAHEVLVRGGRDGAAEIWRRAVAERTSPIAEEHLQRFQRLCKKYGMRLPSIAEHLGERFVRPLEIDQLCALLGPAIDEIRSGRPPVSLRQLEEHIARFTQEPAGAGFELPSWLEALEQEMEQIQWQAAAEEQEALDPLIRLPQVQLSRAEVEEQIEQVLGDETQWMFGDEE